MKVIYILVLCTTFLFSSVSCKFKLKSNSIYEFSNHSNSSILSVQGELDNGLLYGDLDPANSSITYYDNSSPVCGGSNTSNILITAYCPHELDICWDITLGVNGYQTIIKKDNQYMNNVVIVDSTPCLPKNVSNITVGYYDYDNNDIGFANLNLLAIEEERVIPVTTQLAKIQREQCPNLIKYVDEWEDILSNQNLSLEKSLKTIDSVNYDSTNQSLENINSTLQNSNQDNNNNNNSNEEDFTGVTDDFEINLNIDLELESFESNIESSITNTFNNYSNVFGFSGYGSAPSPINFSFLGNTYSAFDITNYDEHLPLFRNTFITFAYVWGFILVVRDFA